MKRNVVELRKIIIMRNNNEETKLEAITSEDSVGYEREMYLTRRKEGRIIRGG